jgi:hypothetical protein
MANDTQLESDATELRLRAERRLGMMLDTEKQSGRLRTGPDKDIGSHSEPIHRITLADIGIDKKLSSRSQKIGGIGEQAWLRSTPLPRQPDLIKTNSPSRGISAHVDR